MPIVAERFISTLKNKIYEPMTAVSKNVYIDRLDEKDEKCNKIKNVACTLPSAWRGDGGRGRGELLRLYHNFALFFKYCKCYCTFNIV